jgi:hypothetical protein
MPNPPKSTKRSRLQAAEHDDPLAIPDAVRVLRGLGERMGW